MDQCMNLMQNLSHHEKATTKKENQPQDMTGEILSIPQPEEGESGLRATKLNSLLSNLRNMELREKEIRLVR